MALDALLSALEQEAGAKAEAILAEARAEAERIAEQAQAEIAQRRRDALQIAGREARAAANARVGRLRRCVRGEVMRARAAMVERVFDHARAQFSAAPCDPAFRAALPRHLQEALAFAADDQSVTVLCRSELRALLQPLVEADGRITLVEDGSIGHGILLRMHPSGLEVDNTLEARLLRTCAALAIELMLAVAPEDHA